jgi:hypothetical protein
MQNQIVMAVKKCREKHGEDTDEYRDAAKKEVGAILDTFNVVGEVERGVWIDAI